MQIVIELSDEKYNDIQAMDWKNPIWADEVTRAIHEGTVLPEHHGRLGDLDELEQEIINGINAGNYEDGYEQYGHINNMDDCVEAIRYADTILEATEVDHE